MVRDLLTEWALAENQISDTQFEFCPTRNTNQPIYILQRILTVAKLEKKRLFTAFLDLTSAYDNVQRETRNYGPTFKTFMFLSSCSQQ